MVLDTNGIGTLNPFRYRGYYYDTETGFYYLQSRYYDPEVGRFINADEYASTGQGILGHNMFAYCLNSPLLLTDNYGTDAKVATWATTMWWLCGVDAALPIGDLAYLLVLSILAIGAVELVNTTTTATSVPNFITQEKETDDVATDTRTDELPKDDFEIVYYHVTTFENATAIIASGKMIGSPAEGGYVYAWRFYPSNYAIRNSGAHFGVIISFKTKSSFVRDTGITDKKVLAFGPVVSSRPGPIFVSDVKIVGVTGWR